MGLILGPAQYHAVAQSGLHGNSAWRRALLYPSTDFNCGVFLDAHDTPCCRALNLAGLVSHLLVRGLMDVVREMDAAGVAAYHLTYESTDRNAFCGVKDEDLLAMVRYVESSAP